MSEIIGKLEDFSLTKSPKPHGAIHQIGIIGFGSMGQEIAKTISQHGFDVVCLDLDEKRVAGGLDGITRMLDTEILRWGMTNSEKRLIMSRIKGTVDYKNLADCDIVFEAINSRKPGTSLEIRKEILQNAEKYVRRDAILASNTATLMISDLASGLEYPDRAVGLHFMSPADNVKVLEVVRSARTSDEAFEIVSRFVRMLEKKPITLMESPGNVTTRMMCIVINHACEMLMEGIASAQDIDELMKTSLGHQFGPFELADRIGLDKVQKWMDNLYNEFGEHGYKTSPVLKRLVRANFLGKASGQGFYKYDAHGKIVESTITCPEYK
ncbi:MAG TPA: 3-hydroxyacyl-CoA dehydrogenase NAD-binding domain-containing protein [Bacteroidales bacterium]|jgi:3-hydroxybutyryl-CoA dehydrogenase|nr:3-hydroxyacyl-CoA dehydrogenase NAD-binding domain-containing protein [Bacteroidales bacterium]